MSFIQQQNWRYATKKFDPSKKLQEEDVETLKEAIRLSASSYGLQLYKVLVISDQGTKEKLRKASWDQSQVSDASHIFVLCNYNQVREEDVDELLDLKAQIQSVDVESIKGYGDFIKKSMKRLSPEQQSVWTAKQCYIALGNLLNQAAELKIDSCPMEGFDSVAYDEILNLSEQNLNAAVVAAVGFRHAEDPAQFAKKVRKPKKQLFQEI